MPIEKQKMKLKDAQKVVSSHGHTLKHDHYDREYKVYPKGASENHPSTYFTNDLEDAVNTSAAMKRQREKNSKFKDYNR